MISNIDPTTTAAWRKLKRHHKINKTTHIKDLFAADKDRFEHFSIRFDDILVDYSKIILLKIRLNYWYRWQNRLV